MISYIIPATAKPGSVLAWVSKNKDKKFTVVAATDRSAREVLGALPSRPASVGMENKFNGRNFIGNKTGQLAQVAQIAEWFKEHARPSTAAKPNQCYLVFTSLSVDDLCCVNNWLDGKTDETCLSRTAGQVSIGTNELFKLELDDGGKIVDDLWIDL